MTENVGERPSSSSIFGEDGRLSSASAAQSLKYAKAQDLPSYPSTGGVQLSSAGAAASLASSQRKSFEHWKPGPIPAANKAAMLAKDHKMDPLWQPEASAAGAGAAIKAHANPIEVEPMQPKKPAKSTNPGANYDTPEDTHRKAMMAATAVHNRRRSGSAPMQPVAKPDSTAWALKAATKSHKEGPARAPSTIDQPFASGDPGFEAARIQNIAKNNVDRQMYSSSPPVSIEVQEKNRQDTLRASAVAMAQKMYAIQQKHIDEASGKTDSQALAASRARSSTFTGTSSNADSNEYSAYNGGYENLEEAARKLAQERLAKIHDEHAEYRNYYGATSPQRRSRLSVRLGGRRASSVADDDDSDEENSRRIRSQMSIFKSNLAEVDSKKRQQDRDTLLQIAHRNVDSQISRMDERVFQDTGKASPAQMEKWEKAAREKAQRDSDTRMQNVGKVHIGGGKYLDQSELDAIAKARLQPTLDDISEKAEKQRALDEERRLEEERQREQAAKEKARAAETAAQLKAETDRQKAESKAQKDEEKRVQREQDAAERAKRDEEKRLRREQETAERIKRDEERKAQKAAEVEEKERVRREKEMQRKEKDSKPGRLSAFFGRSGGAPTTGTTVPAVSTSTHDGTSEAVQAEEGETVHDKVTMPTVESVAPTVESLQEPTTTGIADTLVDPAAGRRTADETTTVDELPSIDQSRTSTDRDQDPASPTKSGVRSWMKTRFGRKSNAQEERDTVRSSNEISDSSVKGKEVEKDEMPRTDSMRDVAMAGRTTTNETNDMYGSGKPDVSPERSAPASSNVARQRSPSISSISSDEPDEKTETEPEPRSFSLGTTETSDSEPRGRTGFRNKLMKKIKPGKDKHEKQDDKAVEPVASNTTDDEFEEARDTFHEETLAPPPPLSSVTGEGSKGKPISPKGSREGSRFTEEL